MTTPQTGYRFSGGSASEEQMEHSSSSIISILQPGVDYIKPSDKKVGLMTRFLPAHNLALKPGTPEFKQGMIPYRDRNNVDTKTMQESFTNWYLALRVFNFLGRQNLSLTSPSSRPEGASAAERACPVTMLVRYCKENPQYAQFITKPAAPTPTNKYCTPDLEYAAVCYISNVISVHRDAPNPKLNVLMLSRGAHNTMATALGRNRPHDLPANLVDPNWPNYMLGDITDPVRGLVAQVKPVQAGPSPTAQPWTPCFSQKDDRPEGMTPYPVTMAQIEGRYDIMSSDVVRIESFQYIVELLIADGFLPRDLIAAACGGMCDIPGGGAPTPTFQTAATGFPGVPTAPAAQQGGFGFPAAAPAAQGGFNFPAPDQEIPMSHPAPSPAMGGFPAPGGFSPAGFGAPVAPVAPAMGGTPAFGGFLPAGSFAAPQASAPTMGGFPAPAAPAMSGFPAPSGFGGPAGFPAPAAPGVGGFPAAPGVGGFPAAPGAPAMGGFGAPAFSPLGAGAQPQQDTPFTQAPPPPPQQAPQLVAPEVAAATYWAADNNAQVLDPATGQPIQASLEKLAGMGLSPSAQVCCCLKPAEGWKPLSSLIAVPTMQAPPAAPPPVTGFQPVQVAGGPLSGPEREEYNTLDVLARTNPATLTPQQISRLGDLTVRASI